jgi:uncharacterized membrane protein
MCARGTKKQYVRVKMGEKCSFIIMCREIAVEACPRLCGIIQQSVTEATLIIKLLSELCLPFAYQKSRMQFNAERRRVKGN